MSIRSIEQIVEDDRTSWQKAEECLVTSTWSSDSDDRNALRTGAVTYALLAVVEELQNVRESIERSAP